MKPSGTLQLMKEAPSPTIDQPVLYDLYQTFTSKGWESLQGRQPTPFRIGGKYGILPRIGSYGRARVQAFTGKHDVIPTLEFTEAGIPILYPADWDVEERDDVSYGLTEVGDRLEFFGLDFRNDHVRLHLAGDVMVNGKLHPLPNNQVFFDYDHFPEIAKKYLNDISELVA